MGIDPNLMEDILTVSITVARGESIKRHLNQEKAGGNCGHTMFHVACLTKVLPCIQC